MSHFAADGSKEPIFEIKDRLIMLSDKSSEI